MAQEETKEKLGGADDFLKELENQEDQNPINNNSKKEKGGKIELIIKKATIQLTEKEYRTMQIADINISQICTKLLRNHLSSKSVQENVKQKLGVMINYFGK